MSTKFKNIHLAPENEEDDIYEGYDDFQLDVSHVTRENTVLYILYIYIIIYIYIYIYIILNRN